MRPEMVSRLHAVESGTRIPMQNKVTLSVEMCQRFSWDPAKVFCLPSEGRNRFATIGQNLPREY